MTKITKLGDVAAFYKGQGLLKSDISPGAAYPCIHYGELFTNYGAVINHPRSRTDRNLPIGSMAGDVLMPTSDVTPTGLATASAIMRAGVMLGGDVLVIRPDKRRVDPRFLAYLIRNESDQVLSRVHGSTIYHLYASDMSNFGVVLPPIAVQARVASVLEDVDKTIDSLEQLIAKKQFVKQGMMQQLLTGRTRLPGFQEEWGEHKLGNLAEVQTGSRNNQDKQAGGRYPFFVRSAKVEKIDSFSYDCEAILVPGDGGIGSIFHYVNGKFEVHQRVYKISDFTSEVNARFLYYYMRQFFGRHAKENSVKATVDSLRLPTFENFRVNLPPIEEQQAIVYALRASDEEIGLLHQKLEKARDVKTGMMQELLTGRVQLPVGATV